MLYRLMYIKYVKNPVMFSIFTVVLGECGNVLTGRIYFGFQEWCLILHWCQIMSVPFGLEIDKKKKQMLA